MNAYLRCGIWRTYKISLWRAFNCPTFTSFGNPRTNNDFLSRSSRRFCSSLTTSFASSNLTDSFLLIGTQKPQLLSLPTNKVHTFRTGPVSHFLFTPFVSSLLETVFACFWADWINTNIFCLDMSSASNTTNVYIHYTIKIF